MPFYLIARHIDGGLREAAPWEPERGTGDTQRYMMGRKPMVWWEGYDFPSLVQYERMTADQMADAYVSVSDFVLLECFRVAYYPTVDFTRGVASAVAALPALKDCLDAGWQPVPAGRGEGRGLRDALREGAQHPPGVGQRDTGGGQGDGDGGQLVGCSRRPGPPAARGSPSPCIPFPPWAPSSSPRWTASRRATSWAPAPREWRL